jgi:hypothetical protein
MDSTQRDDMMDSLLDSIAHDEHMLEDKVDNLDHTMAGDKALQMLRNAARVGTVAEVKSTLQTIVGLAPTPVLEAISGSLETAQSFVFMRTGNSIRIRRR